MNFFYPLLRYLSTIVQININNMWLGGGWRFQFYNSIHLIWPKHTQVSSVWKKKINRMTQNSVQIYLAETPSSRQRTKKMKITKRLSKKNNNKKTVSCFHLGLFVHGDRPIECLVCYLLLLFPVSMKKKKGCGYLKRDRKALLCFLMGTDVRKLCD